MVCSGLRTSGTKSVMKNLQATRFAAADWINICNQSPLGSIFWSIRPRPVGFDIHWWVLTIYNDNGDRRRRTNGHGITRYSNIRTTDEY